MKFEHSLWGIFCQATLFHNALSVEQCVRSAAAIPQGLLVVSPLNRKHIAA